MESWTAAPRPPNVTLEKLVELLGPDVVTAVMVPSWGVEVRSVVLGVQTLSSAVTPASLVIAVGLDPSQANAAQLLDVWASVGVAGVVIQSQGADLERLRRLATNSGIALFEASEKLSWENLQSLVEHAIGMGSRSSQASSRGLDDLIAALASEIGMPVLVEGPEREVLAYSAVDDALTDDGRRRAILSRQCSDTESTAGDLAQLLRARDPVSFGPGTGRLPRLATALFSGSDYLGALWALVPPPGATRRHQAILRAAAPLIAVRITSTQRVSGHISTIEIDRIRRLVSGGLQAQTRATNLGLSPDGPFRIVLAAPKGRHTGNGRSIRWRLAHMVALTTTAHRLSVLIGTLENEFDEDLLIVTSGVSESTARRLADRLVVDADRLGEAWVVGIGEAVPQADELPRSLADAESVLVALDSGFSNRASGTLHDVRTAYYFEQLWRLSMSENIEPLLLDEVFNHDQQHNTEYGTSLSAWCQSGFNVVPAAHHLALHPNTLRYRLQRATEIFDLDLEDEGVRLAFALQAFIAGRSRRSDG